MKAKGFVIGALITLALVVTSFSFAYWSNIDLEDTVEDTTVTIGEGRQTTVTASLNASGSGTLVPAGEVANSVSADPTESIEYTFFVTWADNAFTGETADLDIVIENISNVTAAGLLNFSIDPIPVTTITEGVQLTVTITVTLDAPADSTEYDAIINDDVTFDVVFTVSDPALD